MRRRILKALSLGLLTGLSGPALAAPPMTFIYPGTDKPTDLRETYYWTLLRAALDVTRERFGDYSLSPTSQALAGTTPANVLVMAGSPENARNAIQIPLPIDKGISGFRLFFVMASNQAAMAQVTDIDELRQFAFGQQGSWADTPILERNGFRVVRFDGLDALFRGLGTHRFELFPRGLNEIRDEWLARKADMPDLTIERKLLLHYPFARHFTVPRTPEGEQMAARIREGLMTLAASGEFERRYQMFKRAVLNDIPLAGRRVFRLANPGLSPQSPPQSDRTWWDNLSGELDPYR